MYEVTSVDITPDYQTINISVKNTIQLTEDDYFDKTYNLSSSGIIQKIVVYNRNKLLFSYLIPGRD